MRWVAVAELAGLGLAVTGWWLESVGLIAFGLTIALVVTVAFLPLKWLADHDRTRNRKKKQHPPQR